MVKEKNIRTIIPFLIVFLSTFFLADADIFHDFGVRYEVIMANMRLLGLLITGNLGLAIVCFLSSLIFFTAWKKNRHRNVWYSDLHWQLAGLCFGWAILCVMNLLANFNSYLWIQGMIRLFVFLFSAYFLNTLYRARKILYHPESREESIRKAAKYDELIALIKKEAEGGTVV
jgi:hypothetical protein